MAVDNETPTLANTILSAINSVLCNVHVCLPASVVSYDKDTQKATVQPQIKRTYVNGDVVDLPQVRDVPVVWPRAGGAAIHFPMEAGDQVVLVFSERSLDEWKDSGSTVEPAITRKFDLSDAFAIPGGYPFSNPIEKLNGKDIEFIYGKAQMRVTEAGKYEFRGEKEEVLDLLIQALELLSTTTTNTMLGPMKLNGFATFKQLSQKLKVLKA